MIARHLPMTRAVPCAAPPATTRPTTPEDLR